MKLLDLIGTQTPADPSFAWWEGLLNRVGWPVLIIAGIVYVGIRFSRWFTPLVEALVRAAIGFITKLDDRLGSLEKSSSDATAELHEQGKTLREMADALKLLEGKKP